MAEKKKRPSPARPRAATEPAVAVAPPAVAVAVARVEAAPVEAAPVQPAPVQPAPAAAVAAAAEEAPVGPMLAGLEVDARPTIQMPAPPPQVTHDVIARRAHEIHLTRGGSAFDNWLQAERELGADRGAPS